jgi:hypothetical protein
MKILLLGTLRTACGLGDLRLMLAGVPALDN